MASTKTDIDPTKLTPTSLEAMNNQATINIGIIGHVAHGKSALVRALTGINTIRYKDELERNITIRIGYADAKIYKCNNDECPRPDCFKAYGSKIKSMLRCTRPGCGGTMNLICHVSFVDCPGHEVLMKNMLNGAAVMDAAILLVAANEQCPQPQTAEHLAAAEIMQLNNIVVVQNKVDLVNMDQAAGCFNEIKEFTKQTSAENSSIVPISAELQFNIDAVVEHLCRDIPIPMRDFAADPHLVVIRSFNINNPGDHKHPEKDDVVKSLKGGIAGGSITKGVLRVGDVVEIRPGLVEWDENMQVKVRPLKTRVESLHSESKKLQFAVPGGLIGVGTRLDPYLCRQDRLVGNVIGKPGCMPKVFVELTVSYTLLHRLLGTAGKEGAKVSKLRINDTLQINVGASAVLAVVTGLKDNLAKFRPNKPVCADIGESIAISRKVDGFRLIGWAKIVKGKALALDDN